ncbi:MAG: hypothetical protein JNJ54_32660 [Myxococcaceae bacterium]|nr:hypothetical protein [Myxococcaceae bacterium]
MNPLFRFALASSMAVLLFGCDGCRPDIKTTVYGEPRLLIEEGGVNVETTEVNFGSVPMTKKVTRTVIIRNVGRADLRLDAFAKEGTGPAVQLGTAVIEPNPVFGIDFEPFDLPVGESKELVFFFQPPDDQSMAQVPHEVKLKLVLPNADPNAPPALLTLKGLALRGECEFPARIDFGAVARGDTFSITQTLKNRRMVDSFPRIGDIASADMVFGLSSDSPRGEFTLAPGRDKNVTFTFAPTETRDYFGTIKVLPADGCPEVNVRLVGSGVDNVLSWAPTTLDFGYVQPGLTVPGEVTFSNQSFKAVELTNLATREGANPSNIYRVTGANMGDLTKLTIPAATRDMASNAIVPGTAKATLSFRPAVLGPRQATFTGQTDARNQPSFTVALRGFGGGPDIDLLPANTLNFGRIAYFSGSSASATRRVTVRNVGTRPTPPDPRANLKLGAMGAGRPYWTVTAKNPESSLSEICVGRFDPMNGCANDLPSTGAGSYNPAVGLEAAGAAASLDIPIRVQPSNTTVGASGNKEWEVTFFSNDPDEPEVRLTVTARPVTLPPCAYTVTPVSLNFGVVSPPSTKDLTFQVCNVAPATATGDICLVTNMDLGAGSDPMFSLPAGSLMERELAPQECMTVQTRAWPQGALPPTPTTVNGSVTFTISDPTPGRSQPVVQLTATLAPSCLVISPNALDFGTVQQGCNSPDRTFTVYNACPQQVRWVNAGLIAAGDTAMPMTANCPGATSCQEFNVVNQPNTAGLPQCNVGGATGPCLNQGGTPLSFQIKYRPVNIGTDSGAYRIQVVQGGQQVDYVVTLQGRGDTMGFNTDTFSQDSRPKADILLVIDNSCSMSDEQQALGTNFSSFIQYAVTSQVDFNIAVTSTDADDELMCPNCETGDFCRVGGVSGGSCVNGSGARILSSTTQDVQTQFADLVRLGTSGSGIETCVAPAVKALTAPKITDPAKNAGFLRPDAVLAVVCVTDEAEQANQPMSFYINQLINIKGAQRPNMFSYNVIGPFTALGPNCNADDSGGRHAQLVAATNGLREEICTPNWATALENIGKGAFGFRTTFFLNGTPQAGNMVEVAIDGMPLPPMDTRGAVVWRYDSAVNAVVFAPLYVPEPGKVLTISYRVACL